MSNLVRMFQEDREPVAQAGRRGRYPENVVHIAKLRYARDEAKRLELELSADGYRHYAQMLDLNREIAVTCKTLLDFNPGDKSSLWLLEDSQQNISKWEALLARHVHRFKKGYQ